MYQWYVSTYVVSYVKLVANSSTTKPQCTGPVHAILHYYTTTHYLLHTTTHYYTLLHTTTHYYTLSNLTNDKSKTATKVISLACSQT
jgi:hypothetical protein